MNDTEKRAAFNKERSAQRRRLQQIRNDTLVAVTLNLKTALEQIRAILGSSPSDFQSYLLPQLEAQILAILQGVGNNSAEIVKQALSDSWETGIQMIDAPLLKAGIAVSALIPQVDARQLVTLQHFGTRMIKNVSKEIAEKINTQLGLTVIGAQPYHQTLEVITHILGESDLERALRITRTELGRAYSVSGNDRFMLASKRLPGLQKEWVKSGKRHPRPSHVAAHGQRRGPDEFFMIGGIPMKHPHDPNAPAAEVINCGCTTVPYMASWGIK